MTSEYILYIDEQESELTTVEEYDENEWGIFDLDTERCYRVCTLSYTISKFHEFIDFKLEDNENNKYIVKMEHKIITDRYADFNLIIIKLL